MIALKRLGNTWKRIAALMGGRTWERLAGDLADRQDMLGVGLRGLAKDMGLCVATTHRLMNGRRGDAETYVHVCNYLGFSAQRYVRKP